MEKTITGDGLVFEVVEEFPLGYLIWDVSENLIPGYLPLCRLCSNQPFPGGRNIEVDTLKAIKCEGAQTILAAMGYGPEAPEEMEEYISKYANDPANDWIVQRMKKALPLMRKLKWPK